MNKDFEQIAWDARLRQDAQRLVRLALAEDLGPQGDCTTAAIVPEQSPGRALVVVRQSGVIAGLGAAEVVLGEVDRRLHFHLFPRTEWLLREYLRVHPQAWNKAVSGPALFEWARQAFVPGNGLAAGIGGGTEVAAAIRAALQQDEWS